MPRRSARALTAAIVGGTVAIAVPSPALAADAKYADRCAQGARGDILPEFNASLSRPIIRKGQTTTYTLVFAGPFNHIEVGFFANGEYLPGGGVIHYAETSVARVTVRPSSDTVVTWSGAIFCEPDSHYDLAAALSPETVKVVPPRRPWNRIVQVQRSLLSGPQ